MRAFCPHHAGYRRGDCGDWGNRGCACQRQILMGESPHIQPYLRLHLRLGKEIETMRNLLSVVLILSLAAGPLAAQTSEWKTYKNTSGNFIVLFPGEPADSINKTEGDLQSHTLLARDGPVVYTVVYTVMTSAQTVDEATFQAFKLGVFKELPKCEADAEQPVSPVLESYIGHAYRLNCDMPNAKVTLVGNLYWGKHYSFAVMTMFAASVAEPTSTEKKFVDSFAVIDAAK